MPEKSENGPAAGAREDKANCPPEWRQIRRAPAGPLAHRSEDRAEKTARKRKTTHAPERRQSDEKGAQKEDTTLMALKNTLMAFFRKERE